MDNLNFLWLLIVLNILIRSHQSLACEISQHIVSQHMSQDIRMSHVYVGGAWISLSSWYYARALFPPCYCSQDYYFIINAGIWRETLISFKHWDGQRRLPCLHGRMKWYENYHDDVLMWKRFLHYWPFVGGIDWSPMDSPHKGPAQRFPSQRSHVGSGQNFHVIMPCHICVEGCYELHININIKTVQTVKGQHVSYPFREVFSECGPMRTMKLHV